MKKIISLFKRNHDGDRLVYDEVTPDAYWVTLKEGVPTVKHDGTCCLIKGGQLFKRYDRKLHEKQHRLMRSGEKKEFTEDDFRDPPEDWTPAEDSPSLHTGHWPGWVPVGDGTEDKYHREADDKSSYQVRDGTYELVGKKVKGNPYRLDSHYLWEHGEPIPSGCPRDFDGLKAWLETFPHEGVVWHHPDGRMVKIKRKDFGFHWPLKDLSDEDLPKAY